MSIDKSALARGILEHLTAELDEANLHRTIDARIDAATSRFPRRNGSCQSHRIFLETVGRFVGHLYACGLRTPQSLTLRQASTEAVSLLERAYRSETGADYDAASLDAVGSDGPGLDAVLARIAETVKLKERESYVGWVCAEHLVPCGWYIRCLIAEQLLAHHGPFLPEQIRESDPAQWADDIPHLIGVDSATDQYLDRSF